MTDKKQACVYRDRNDWLRDGTNCGLCVGPCKWEKPTPKEPMTDKKQHATGGSKLPKVAPRSTTNLSFLTNMIMGEKAEITITLGVGGGVDIDGVRIFFDGFSLTATKISGVF